MNHRFFAGGHNHSVFLTNEGVFTSGSNASGQLGVKRLSSENKAQKVTGLEGEDIVSVGCCDFSTFFLSKNGRVFACGNNDKGQLGCGYETSKKEPILVSFPYEQLIQSIDCGGNFVMALTKEGILFGWGSNFYGQIGVGHTNFSQTITVPLETLSSHKVLSVACGYSHTLALTKAGKLFSWGLNDEGQLGHGHRRSNATPTLVSTFSQYKITQIACGGNHSMTLVKEGNKTLCFSWGSGMYGQLGHGDEEDQLKPKLIESLKQEKITLLDCGLIHSLAMTKEGTIFTWGDNNFGQLCLEDKVNRVLPTQVKELDKKDIVHCCCSKYGSGFITRKGKLLVCGENGEGQFGIGNRNKSQTNAVEVPLSSEMLIPSEIAIERAVKKSARFVLFVLCPEYERLKRKRIMSYC